MIKDRFDIHVPSSLPRNTPIYRIIDFFSAAHRVTTNSLYIPIAERLKDSNEGIDAALDLYAVSAGSCAGIASFLRLLMNSRIISSGKRGQIMFLAGAGFV